MLRYPILARILALTIRPSHRNCPNAPSCSSRNIISILRLPGTAHLPCETIESLDLILRDEPDPSLPPATELRTDEFQIILVREPFINVANIPISCIDQSALVFPLRSVSLGKPYSLGQHQENRRLMRRTCLCANLIAVSPSQPLRDFLLPGVSFHVFLGLSTQRQL